MQNLAVSAEELREKCQHPNSLNLYASLVMGEEYTHAFPPTHEAYWALLVRAAQNKDARELRFALGLPRGFAKTTLIKLFVSWLYGNTDFQFPLVVSANAEKAVRVIDDVVGFMETPNWRSLYGNWKHDVETDRTDLKVFRFNGKWRVLCAIGAGGSVRGMNVKNRRPDVIVLEDAQDKESAKSDTLNSEFLDWMLGTLYKARSYERSICIFIGNMYNEQCALNQLRKNKLWLSLISGGITRAQESLWPEFRSIESLLEEWEMDESLGRGHIFLAEVQNDPLALVNNTFDSSKLRPYPFAEDEQPAVSYIIIDPALGKLTSDDTVIGLIHVLEGKPVLRKIIAEKLDDEQTVRRALKLALAERSCLIVVEGVAYQQTLQNYFNREMRRLHITGIATGITGPRGKSKNARIKRALEKWLTQEIEIHPEVRSQVLAQVQRWNPLKRENEDDILDVAGYMDPVLAENRDYLYTQVSETFLPQDMRDSGNARVLSEYETSCF